jgi:hypothetical protein
MHLGMSHSTYLYIRFSRIIQSGKDIGREIGREVGTEGEEETERGRESVRGSEGVHSFDDIKYYLRTSL